MNQIHVVPIWSIAKLAQAGGNAHTTRVPVHSNIYELRILMLSVNNSREV